MPRSLLVLLAALALTLAGGAVAVAQGVDQAEIDKAASALARDPVYQDPAAENALDAGELRDLRRTVRDTGKPISVAILPRSAGDPDDVVVDIARTTGQRGTYAVVTGTGFRVASNAEPMSTARAESRAAFAAHQSDGVAAVLEDFVRRSCASSVSLSARSASGS